MEAKTKTIVFIRKKNEFDITSTRSRREIYGSEGGTYVLKGLIFT